MPQAVRFLQPPGGMMYIHRWRGGVVYSTHRRLPFMAWLGLRWPYSTPDRDTRWGVTVAFGVTGFFLGLVLIDAFDGSSEVSMVFSILGVALLGVALLVHVLAKDAYLSLQTDHAFRFPAMQEATPGVLLAVMYADRVFVLGASDVEESERILNAWLQDRWVADARVAELFERWDRSDAVECHADYSEAFLAAAVAFMQLPLVLLDTFRQDVDAQIATNRSDYADAIRAALATNSAEVVYLQQQNTRLRGVLEQLTPGR